MTNRPLKKYGIACHLLKFAFEHHISFILQKLGQESEAGKEKDFSFRKTSNFNSSFDQVHTEVRTAQLEESCGFFFLKHLHVGCSN